MQNLNRKAIKIIASILLFYGVAVATHAGEFWPFSIYPMFSRAGKPWMRSLVRDVTGLSINEQLWQPTDFENLPGRIFSFDEIGINQNDVANFIQKAGEWDEQTIQGMRTLYGKELNNRDLLLMQVVGRLTGSQADLVNLTYTPLMVMTKDTTILNPSL